MAKLLSILLQRSDSGVPWGFSLEGGQEQTRPLTIAKVIPGTLAAQYLAPGDLLLTIEGLNADALLLTDAAAMVQDPGKSLDLLVRKVPSPSARGYRGTPPSTPGVRSPTLQAAPIWEFKATPTSPRKRSYRSQNSTLSPPATSSNWEDQETLPHPHTAFVTGDCNSPTIPHPPDYKSPPPSLTSDTPVSPTNIPHRHDYSSPARVSTPPSIWDYNGTRGYKITPPSSPTMHDGYNNKVPQQHLVNGHNHSQPHDNPSREVRNQKLPQDSHTDDSDQYTIELRQKVSNNRRAFLENARTGGCNPEPKAQLQMVNGSTESVPKTKGVSRSHRHSSPESDGLSGAIRGDERRPNSLPPTRNEEQRRQSSQLSSGSTPSPGPGGPGAPGDGVTASVAPTFPAPPAPPPPPPPGSGHVPTVRLNTEIPNTRGPPNRGSTYEPPAAIQNAMMTKDKKPFTYTPGGLDLSQIRSPRMQRRITRNANAEGVPEQSAAPKPSPLTQPQGPLPPSALAAMQPQMAVPVFPTGGGSGGPHLHHVNTAPGFHAPPPPPVPSFQAQAPPPPPPQPAVVKTQAPSPQPTMVKTQTPSPQPTMVKAPASPLQPTMVKMQPQAPRPVSKAEPASPPFNEPGSIYVPPVSSGNPRGQLGSLYIPPIQSSQPPPPETPMSPIHGGLSKAPTPWMSQRPQQPSVPAWASREEAQPGTRIIPIQIEREEPPTPPSQPIQATQSAQQANTRIIPIQIQMEDVPPQRQQQHQQQQQQQQQQQRRPVYVHNKFNPPTPTTPGMPAPIPSEGALDQNPRQLQQQQSWAPPGSPGAPIQSRSFRVLQKITDTDNPDGTDQPEQYQEYPYSGQQWGPPQSTQGVPVQQLRKMQLNEDDRALMNKFKAQVSEETPMNEEENPRYRGGHIPSRVFKMLDDSVPRAPGTARGPQARPASTVQASSDSPPQPYIPASEQQVQEPRKYTGGAIPSRSFRMLQAMTASPENCGPGQSDM